MLLRRAFPLLLAASLSAAGATAAGARPAAAPACSGSSVPAQLSWGSRCLRAGEFCKVGNAEYRRYGFECPAGRLVARGGAGSSGQAPASPRLAVGRTVLLGPRGRGSGCTLGVRPDRRCSPGAYYSGLTRAVVCSASFRTGDVRDVPQSEKFAVEREYGLAARLYGHTLEIDHVVPLELGGSNALANLYPEEAAFPGGAPGYHVKDALENRLHALVCAGSLSLGAARTGIARDWVALYRDVVGPLG